jgi:hypothetical protein
MRRLQSNSQQAFWHDVGGSARDMIDSGSHQLVELARAGDQDAFTELFRESRPQIEAAWREIFRGPGSEADLGDFCSDEIRASDSKAK